MTAIALAVVTVWASVPGPTNGTLPLTLDLTDVRSLVVQHDGRWPPLDTVARDIVESVTGEERFRGADPVAVLLAWTFDAATWMSEPLVKIRNAELRAELDLPLDRQRFSYAELIRHAPLIKLINELRHIEPGRKPDPLESKVSDIEGKLVQLQTVFDQRAIRLVPDPHDPLGAWRPLSTTAAVTNDDTAKLHDAWKKLAGAFVADERPAFQSATRALLKAAAAAPSARHPTPAQVTAELRYNRLDPFGLAWKLMAVGFVLSLLSPLGWKRWLDGGAVCGLIAGFAVVTYGLSLRWQIAGRIPASNMYESLLFLGWGMAAFSTVSLFLFRIRLVPLTALGMSTVALALADVLPIDHFVRPIAPVLLDTVWMSIHVPVIMVSYSVLALALLIAHAQLVVKAAMPRRTQIAITLDRLHYWYVHIGSILLTAGIITGSMWAASSWGRYWGWDPKEVWSLVALLGYLTILHVRLDHEKPQPWAYALGAVMMVLLLILVTPSLAPLTAGKILALLGAVAGIAVLVLAHGQFATAVKSVLCFWLIVMTYVGVNYVLGTGLHSYGFGTGAVARSMFLIGGVDLLFVVACVAVYWARNMRITPAVREPAPHMG